MCSSVRKIIHSLKLVDYLHVQADNPWYNYYIRNEKRRVISSLIFCKNEEIYRKNLLSAALGLLVSSADITLANSLNPDQTRQNVRPDLDPNCYTLIEFLKDDFGKKSAE